MISVFVLLGPLFYFPDPVFICGEKECYENTGGCKDQVLKPSEYKTITSEYKLYCDKSELRSIALSMLFFGPVLGNFIINFFAD
jgi:hypothetical protein